MAVAQILVFFYSDRTVFVSDGEVEGCQPALWNRLTWRLDLDRLEVVDQG